MTEITRKSILAEAVREGGGKVKKPIKRKLKSCMDESVTYLQCDNVRFIFRDGDYVGWYAC